jgi:hypothetical protein
MPLAAIRCEPVTTHGLPSIMDFSNILGLCISILGLYGLICYLRFLITRNVFPRAEAVLAEAEHLLNRAESTGVIPQPLINEYRSTLAR